MKNIITDNLINLLETPIQKGEGAKHICAQLVEHINEETVDDIFKYLEKLPVEIVHPILAVEYKKRNILPILIKSQIFLNWANKQLFPYYFLEKNLKENNKTKTS